MRSSLVRAAAFLSVTVALALVGGPAGAAAQEIYLPRDLTEAPKIVSLQETARLIRDSYPLELRHRRVGGTVKLQFVVGADGAVEAETIRVVASTESELQEAAISVAEKLQFSPPKVNALAVRTQVILPVIYQP